MNFINTGNESVGYSPDCYSTTTASDISHCQTNLGFVPDENNYCYCAKSEDGVQVQEFNSDICNICNKIPTENPAPQLLTQTTHNNNYNYDLKRNNTNKSKNKSSGNLSLNLQPNNKFNNGNSISSTTVCTNCNGKHCGDGQCKDQENCNNIGDKNRNKFQVKSVNAGTGSQLLFGFTRRQFVMLLTFCLTDMMSLSCVSLHAPFYPKVAEKKGASPTAAGFVFGIFQLTVFLMSLVYGSLLGRIGPKRMATTGIIVMALSSMVFGLLDRVEDAEAFITLSFVIRIIQANGNAGFVTASFAIIANEFPTSVAKAISYMETAAGLGLIIGPAVGGGLYKVGGFLVPFIVMGILLLAAGVLAFFYMPDVEIPVGGNENDKSGEKPPGMLKLLAIPTVALAAFSIFGGAVGIGYLLPTLEPHVNKNFNLDESFTGLIFILDGAAYALTNPAWGWLCDKFGQPRYISLIGSILIFFGFCIIGPVSFFPWGPTLWVTCVGCVIFGLGLGASFVSGFIQGLVEAKSRGFPDTVATYGLVSGMWFSMMSLGSFTGASAGGALSQHFGFQNGTYLILVMQLLLAALTIAFIFIYRNQRNFDINGGSNPEDPISNNKDKVKSVVAA